MKMIIERVWRTPELLSNFLERFNFHPRNLFLLLITAIEFRRKVAQHLYTRDKVGRVQFQRDIRCSYVHVNAHRRTSAHAEVRHARTARHL